MAPKSMEKNIFHERDKFFLSKRCSGLMKSSLDKPFRMFLLKVPKLTNQVLKPERKILEDVFLDCVYGVYRKHSKNFAFFRLFLCQSLRKKKESTFIKKLVFLKSFTWAHWINICLPCGNFLPKVRKCFAQTPKNSKKTLILEIKIFFQNDP